MALGFRRGRHIKMVQLISRCAMCPPILQFTRILTTKPFSEKTRKSASSLTHHWVEPMDGESNLRRIKFVQSSPPNRFDKMLNKYVEDTYAWNVSFWKSHNQEFFKQKKMFSKGSVEENERDVSDDISVFYKKFLDEYYASHMSYNKEWYKRNFGMLYLSLRASLTRLLTFT